MSLKSKVMGAVSACFLLFFGTSAQADGHLLPMAELGEDGLYVQPWIHDSFLDLNEDLAEAEADGKRLMIVWEQRGCPYCKRMHEVNLRIPRVVESLEQDFMVLQLNLWGDREVTDFDGEVLKEKELANKWRVMFTPTMQFFPAKASEIGGKAGVDAEVVRIPGYFKPFHFYFLLHYAKTGGYAEEPSFQRWLGGIAEKLEEKGVHYELYADDLPKDLPKDL
ncbi:thioredoxin family protein [Magnetovibrio sp. PR-2]|uniref:thioredoxin family protein n=1 Tax=Magnetovibrio sp. PR-2 TaxID=3120356 RepID=UPI002FCE0038